MQVRISQDPKCWINDCMLSCQANGQPLKGFEQVLTLLKLMALWKRNGI